VRSAHVGCEMIFRLRGFDLAPHSPRTVPATAPPGRRSAENLPEFFGNYSKICQIFRNCFEAL
jgi:hypothetical protein